MSFISRKHRTIIDQRLRNNGTFQNFEFHLNIPPNHEKNIDYVSVQKIIIPKIFTPIDNLYKIYIWETDDVEFTRTYSFNILDQPNYKTSDGSNYNQPNYNSVIQDPYIFAKHLEKLINKTPGEGPELYNYYYVSFSDTLEKYTIDNIEYTGNGLQTGFFYIWAKIKQPHTYLYDFGIEFHKNQQYTHSESLARLLGFLEPNKKMTDNVIQFEQINIYDNNIFPLPATPILKLVKSPFFFNFNPINDVYIVSDICYQDIKYTENIKSLNYLTTICFHDKNIFEYSEKNYKIQNEKLKFISNPQNNYKFRMVDYFGDDVFFNYD